MTSLVIGASRGIGLEFCRQLKGLGDTVVAACRKSNSTLDEIADVVIENFEVVNDLNDLKPLASKIEGELDRIFYVTGVLKNQSLETMDFDSIREQFEVNAIGAIKSVMTFKNKLKNGGKIGLLTSRMGSVEDNTSGGSYGYRMSKAALNIAGKSLSVDLEPHGVSVFLLHPGYVRTDMTGGNGMIDPPESVEGLLKIVNDKGLESSGKFFHTNGEELPW